MSLVTGTPIGNLDVQEDIYLESAPSLYFQDYRATPLSNPDSDGFYWGLSGTSVYPVYEIGCPTDVQLTENITMNDVLCDTIGVKDTVQQRNYFELTFTVQSLFPLQTLKHLMKTGTVVETPPTQKMGLGGIDNSVFYHVYAPKVYDENVGDYIAIYLGKAKFVDAFTLTTPFGAPWQLQGIKLRAFADSTKPSAQKFGMFLRSDASVIT